MAKFILAIVSIALVSLATSTCDFSSAYCSSAGVSCPSQAPLVVNNKPFYLQDISVVSFGDLTITNGDIQGRTVVRGNFYAFSGVSVGDTISDGCGYGLIVGGNLYFNTSGAIYPVNQTYFVGGSTQAPDYLTGQVQSCSSINQSAGCLDVYFDSLLNYWTNVSNTLSSQTDNVQVSIDNGVATWNCNSASDENYYVTIPTSSFNNITGYNTSNCRLESNFVLNVQGNDDITIQGNPLIVTGFILVNIGGTGRVNVATSVYGSIVAVRADIRIIGGTIYGPVIAGNFSNVIQINDPVTCPREVASRQSSLSCANYANTGFVTGANTGSASSGSASSTGSASGSATGAATGSASGSSTGSSTGSDSGATSGSNNGSGNSGSDINNNSGLGSNNEETNDATSFVLSATVLLAAAALI